jgi:hypothetical protein
VEDREDKRRTVEGRMVRRGVELSGVELLSRVR